MELPQPPFAAPFPKKPLAFSVKPIPTINDLTLINGRQPEAMGRELASESNRRIQVPVLPLTSSVNLGKFLQFFETQFPHLPVETVTALSTIKGCWPGQKEEWVRMCFVNPRISLPAPTGYPV